MLIFKNKKKNIIAYPAAIHGIWIPGNKMDNQEPQSFCFYVG